MFSFIQNYNRLKYIEKKKFYFGETNIGPRYEIFINTKDRVAYDQIKNEFLNYKDVVLNKGIFQFVRLKEISHNEYFGNLKNIYCNCKIGKGIDIKESSEPYEVCKEYNKRNSPYSIKRASSLDVSEYGRYLEFFSLLKNNKYLNFYVWTEKKCFKSTCKKCGSEIKYINGIEKFINKIIKEQGKDFI